MAEDEFARLLSGPADTVAARLLGCRLEREFKDRLLRGRIVETEAYDQADAASHSYKGRTARTDVMFGPPGRLYVYFTYGLHYCCNVVTGADGYGSAVLIRALEPVGADMEAEAAMSANRRGAQGVYLTNGPAKLCQAFMIDKRFNGHDLRSQPLRLIIGPSVAQTEIVQATRIGISEAKEKPWRFYIKDNKYVSKP